MSSEWNMGTMHQKVTTKRFDLTMSGMNISAYFYIGAFAIDAGDDQTRSARLRVCLY